MTTVYFMGGVVTGCFIISIAAQNSKLRTSFAAWNWPSFGAGVAFALALFIVAGKIQA